MKSNKNNDMPLLSIGSPLGENYWRALATPEACDARRKYAVLAYKQMTEARKLDNKIIFCSLAIENMQFIPKEYYTGDDWRALALYQSRVAGLFDFNVQKIFWYHQAITSLESIEKITPSDWERLAQYKYSLGLLYTLSEPIQTGFESENLYKEEPESERLLKAKESFYSSLDSFSRLMITTSQIDYSLVVKNYQMLFERTSLISTLFEKSIHKCAMHVFDKSKTLASVKAMFLELYALGLVRLGSESNNSYLQQQYKAISLLMHLVQLSVATLPPNEGIKQWVYTEKNYQEFCELLEKLKSKSDQLLQGSTELTLPLAQNHASLFSYDERRIASKRDVNLEDENLNVATYRK